MLELRYTRNKFLIHLYATRRYMPETLESVLHRARKPWFVRVSGVDIPIESDDQARIVCRMVAEDHNELSSAPIDDGFDEETRQLEWDHEYQLLVESSSESSDVHSEDDLVYERHAYI